MKKKIESWMKNIFVIIFTISLFGLLSHHLYRNARLSSSSFRLSSFSSSSTASASASPLSTVSVLIPDWQILVLVSPETPPAPENYNCLFPNKESSPARLAGKLSFSNRTVFTCEFPEGNRGNLPRLQPRLVRKNEESKESIINNNIGIVGLLTWDFFAYEAFTMEYDVVLLVKGVNSRQSFNRPPSDFRCVFGDDPSNSVRTSVIWSVQEIFRCVRPQMITPSYHPVSVTLEILEVSGGTTLVPSVARYDPQQRRTVDFSEPQSLTCACTMVYNVRKFLKEWVTYHAAIGIEKFILYDNDSDDDLPAAVRELNRAGLDVRTVYWPWPKTQEAGFSHCTLYAKQICKWVAFIDVDEFILSAEWLNVTGPNRNMVQSSLLPRGTTAGQIGQVSIKCYEFGPSNRTVNPPEGVTQGYTCRRRDEHRHKSIVLLEAVHPSLLNKIHHFELRRGYRSNLFAPRRAVVNHYKYQAWPEFQAKFRRRVSAFVLDWRSGLNPTSDDHVPGLGCEPVEPSGWAQRFCDVRDQRLQVLTRKWFGVNSSTMAR